MSAGPKTIASGKNRRPAYNPCSCAAGEVDYGHRYSFLLSWSAIYPVGPMAGRATRGLGVLSPGAGRRLGGTAARRVTPEMTGPAADDAGRAARASAARDVMCSAIIS